MTRKQFIMAIVFVCALAGFLIFLCIDPGQPKQSIQEKAGPRGGGIYNPGGGGGAGLATAGSAGIVNFNNGTASTASRSDHTHRDLKILTWYFPGVPASGVGTMVVTFPDGITNAAITDMRVTANTTSAGASAFNIQRCTATCTGAATFANIYAADLALGTNTRTAAKGSAPDQNVSSLAGGDQFKVNLVTVGASLADVTITMTYKVETIN